MQYECDICGCECDERDMVNIGTNEVCLCSECLDDTIDHDEEWV